MQNAQSAIRTALLPLITPSVLLGHTAYHVKDTTTGEHGEKRGVWTRVGAAWPNKDGRGFNMVLDVVPLDGRLILREPMERESAGGMQPTEMV